MRASFLPPLAAIAAFVCALGGPVSAQWLHYPVSGIPRLPDGKPDLKAPVPTALDDKPDLSGIWQPYPGGYALNIVADLKPEEIYPWAETLYRERREHFGKNYPGFRCLPALGPSISLGRLGMYKILQTRDVVALLPEGFAGPADYRQIFIDGRALPRDPNPTWQGYSVGHWDGDTLVVESAGFNSETWLDFGGHPHTEGLRVTERLRRKDFGHMEIQASFHDLKAYARPWTITIDALLMPDTELLETVCGENERDLQHFVTTRDDENRFRANVKVAPDILTKYAGTYELPNSNGSPIGYIVAIAGDRLTIQVPGGGGRYIYFAESEAKFFLPGTPQSIEFVRDPKGEVTHLVQNIAGTRRRFARKRDIQ